MSEARLSQLIGDIYDAALDAERWPRALEKVCGFVGGSQANIFWQDVIGKAAKKVFEWGNDPHYTRLYMEVYAKINPLFPGAYAQPLGEVFSQVDLIPFDELHETRLYREWMQPQGWAVSEAKDRFDDDAPWCRIHALTCQLVEEGEGE